MIHKQDIKGKQVFINGWRYNISYVGDKYCILSNGIYTSLKMKRNKVEKKLKEQK